MIDESKLYEVGLNEKKFCYYLARRALIDYCEEDDIDISNQIFELCSLLGVEDAEKLRVLTDDEFLEIDAFEQGVPKYLAENIPGTSNGSTGFEIGGNGVEQGSELMYTFDIAIKASDFQMAWNYLNSPGWLLKDAKLSFSDLVDAMGKDFFRHLYKEWSALNYPIQGY